MSFRPANLASKPFINLRPVNRVTAVVWTVAAVLTLVNAVLYWTAVFGLEDKREQIELVAAAKVEARERIADTEARMRELDLRQQNLEAEFLNDRIHERDFPWSRLFEDLADVLPTGVRLHSLRPDTFVRRSAGDRGGRVAISVNGAARSTEDLLALLDNLFSSTSFRRPRLPGERRNSDGTIDFTLSVSYLPDRGSAEEIVTAGLLPSKAAAAASSPDRPLGTGSATPASGGVQRSAASPAPPAADASGATVVAVDERAEETTRSAEGSTEPQNDPLGRASRAVTTLSAATEPSSTPNDQRSSGPRGVTGSPRVVPTTPVTVVGGNQSPRTGSTPIQAPAPFTSPARQRSSAGPSPVALAPEASTGGFR